MGDGQLTQEEIDLLLQGADNFSGQSQGAAHGRNAGAENILSPVARDVLLDLIFQSVSPGMPALGGVLGKTVRLGAPFGDLVTRGALEQEFGQQFVIIKQKINGNMPGYLSLILPVADAIKITEVIMGGDGNGGGASGLDSAQRATIKDILNPVLFNTITQVSVRLGTAITPHGQELLVTGAGQSFPFYEEEHFLKIQMSFTVEGLMDSRLNIVLPISVAAAMFKLQTARPGKGGAGGISGESRSATDVEEEEEEVHEIQADIRSVEYPIFSGMGQGPTSPNMDLLMDVQMTLTVELGRTRMSIKEILGLGEGSIIELDKLAGEPVDLLINGKLIAKGEVVVIDENFGVRVTDIVSPVDRLRAGSQGEQSF